MSWIWRVVVAALVIGGIAYWLPSAPSDTAVAAGANGLPVYAPAAANDNVDPCLSGNPRKQKKCNFNNGNPAPSGGGGPVTIDVQRTNDKPAINVPFQMTVTASGSPINTLEWLADGPVTPAAGSDDIAAQHPVTPCAGAQPCTATFTLVARNVGYYNLHIRATDVNGNATQTDIQFLASENPRG